VNGSHEDGERERDVQQGMGVQYRSVRQSLGIEVVVRSKQGDEAREERLARIECDAIAAGSEREFRNSCVCHR
jgi:hypothetical protein